MFKLNPRVDFAFKKLFGSEENLDILKAFINAVLPEEDQVASLKLKNPYTLKSFAKDKLSILDIKAIDTHGRHLTIEMQITDQLHYEKRALFLWSDVYAKQLIEGIPYSDLEKTIAIHVLNFNLMDEEDYHNVYKIKNTKSKKNAFNDFQLHTIELKKFSKDLDHIQTSLDRWVTFLTKAHEFSKNKIPKELKKEAALEKAINVLNSLYLEEDERTFYEARLKWLRDEDASIQRALQKGKLEGIKEGKLEGIKEGKLETAKQLKKRGFSTTEIEDFTGLSEAEIEAA
jgi:predicted transposase/invertase (TIGR01784 family)